MRALMAAAAVADPGCSPSPDPRDRWNWAASRNVLNPPRRSWRPAAWVAMLRSRPPSPPLCGAGCTAGRHHGPRRGGRRAQIRASAAAVLGSSGLGNAAGDLQVGGASVRRSHGYHRPGRRDSFYAELDAHSDALARGLVAVGAGPERLVGVAVDRSADSIVALLAVVKTGAAYLPLDRSHPLARLSRVVADAEPAVIIVDDELAELWSDLPAQRRTVADLVALGATTPAAVLPTAVDPRHPPTSCTPRGRQEHPRGWSSHTPPSSTCSPRSTTTTCRRVTTPG